MLDKIIQFWMRVVKRIQRYDPKAFAETLKEMPKAREAIIREGGARIVIEAEEGIAMSRPKAWGKGRRCNECGNPTWECECEDLE